METLNTHYFKKAKKSPHLWRNEIGIQKGINLFRHNVIQEFIELNNYNLVSSFTLFSEQTDFWNIYTKEDFIYSLDNFYDELGECNYFSYTDSYGEPNTYRQYILDLWSDKLYNYGDVKNILKKWKSCDSYHIDGVLDNMLHAQEDFIDLLPSDRAYKHYDRRKMNLLKESDVMNYLINIKKNNETI